MLYRPLMLYVPVLSRVVLCVPARGCASSVGRVGRGVRHPLDYGGADAAPVAVSRCRVELQRALS